MLARPGMTLVEAALAGALAVMMTLAFMEGLAVAARISRENSELLAAEGYAWDTAWKWLNKKNDDLNGAAAWMYYPNAAGATVKSNECPVVFRAGSPAKCYVRVRGAAPGEFVPATEDIGTREIQVDVEWGPPGARVRLGDFAAGASKSYGINIGLVKGEVDRSE